MLNKKTLFNGVYALALFGAITSCIGILNEFLNLVQFWTKGVANLKPYFTKESLWIPFVYHLLAFILCAFTVIILVLSVTNRLKGKYARLPNACIIITCVIIFALSWTLVYPFQYESREGLYSVRPFDYTTLYTFRSLVMSYIASVGTILFCNITQSIAKKKGIESEQ